MVGFFSCFLKRFGFNGFPEGFFIEDNQDAHTRRNGHVGDVEDGVEEFKMPAANYGKPAGPIPLKNREIEHVYHFAVENRSIRFVRK